MSILNDLAVQTGLNPSDLTRIILTAPRRYKTYPIPKRNGGFRQIAQPSRELKALQRILVSDLIGKLPVHSAATAYISGRNILYNASMHSDNSVILKLDFRNFFNSIKVLDWFKYLKSHKLDWANKEGLFVTSQILFWNDGTSGQNCLSIGAPSSPLVSNIIMFKIDTEIMRYTSSRGVVYSRYADDITLSSNSLSGLLESENFIRSIVSNTRSPTLEINEGKRGLFSKAQKRMVTGLIITPTGSVSVGRQRKRMTSSLLHKFMLRQIEVEDIALLKGMIGFINSVEPSFLSRMRGKYGNEVLDEVLKIQIPRRGLRKEV